MKQAKAIQFASNLYFNISTLLDKQGNLSLSDMANTDY